MAAGAADGCDNRQHLGRRPEMEEGLRSHFEGANQAAIRRSAVPTSDNEQSKKGSYFGSTRVFPGHALTAGSRWDVG